MYVCMHAWMDGWMDVFVHICIYLYIYVCVCLCMEAEDATEHDLQPGAARARPHKEARAPWSTCAGLPV